MAVSRDIRRIGRRHESLGRHLTVSTTSGLTFRYAPERETEWLTWVHRLATRDSRMHLAQADAGRYPGGMRNRRPRGHTLFPVASVAIYAESRWIVTLRRSSITLLGGAGC